MCEAAMSLKMLCILGTICLSLCMVAATQDSSRAALRGTPISVKVDGEKSNDCIMLRGSSLCADADRRAHASREKGDGRLSKSPLVARTHGSASLHAEVGRRG